MSSSSLHAGSTDETRGKCDHDEATCSSPESPGRLQNRKKLRVLVITMGGQRQEQIQALFRDEAFSNDFEEPVFSKGVPSRSLRNRMTFFEVCHEAGLIPELEWQAMQQAASAASNYELDSKNFFSCLDTVPIESDGTNRHCHVGNAADCQVVHYSIELWRKAKTINRGRSVLACLLAHLMAMKKFTNSSSARADGCSFDVLLEDNVRVPVHESMSAATRIQETIQASREYEEETGTTCHLRYYGWLGSLENLQWMHECHLPKRAFHRSASSSSCCCNASKDETTVAPFPTTQDIDSDLLEKKKNKLELDMVTTAMHAQSLEKEEENHDDNQQQQQTAVQEANESQPSSRPPGGTPVWGAYAYWISKHGYEHVLRELQQDVGSLLWKGKRARYYSVKPIDKILPRKIMAHFGTTSVHITSRPTFFRAPMLTSKIHAKWDAGFCQSTQYQLDKFCNGMSWSDLWLTASEKSIVRYHQEHGKWLTLGELETMQQEQQTATATATTTVVGATNSRAIRKRDD